MDTEFESYEVIRARSDTAPIRDHARYNRLIAYCKPVDPKILKSLIESAKK